MQSLEIRIEKKLADIEKCKELVRKQEVKLFNMQFSPTNKSDIEWVEYDLRISKNRLKELIEQLDTLYKQQAKQENINNIERVPVIEVFLERWKLRTIEWYKLDYAKLKESLGVRRQKREQLEQWRRENRIPASYNSPLIKEKKKELGLDIEIDKNILTEKLLMEINWEHMLEKEIEKEKNLKRALFVNRVKEITGTILDASSLTIGYNGEINGVVYGEKSKAKVETITAGGYNIQCFHFRVLVHELK